MESKAKSRWTGTLKEGNGLVSTESGALTDTPYSFATRFEGNNGTNPEELIAAAHSACFSMALSAELGKVKIVPDQIETSAVVILEKQGEGFSVSESRLEATVSARGANTGEIERAAANAKENCPISKLLNAKVSLELAVNV